MRLETLYRFKTETLILFRIDVAIIGFLGTADGFGNDRSKVLLRCGRVPANLELVTAILPDQIWLGCTLTSVFQEIQGGYPPCSTLRKVLKYPLVHVAIMLNGNEMKVCVLHRLPDNAMLENMNVVSVVLVPQHITDAAYVVLQKFKLLKRQLSDAWRMTFGNKK